ncbi:MAG TPA: isochorismatase family cysteine hydrolase [Phycisphaerae bacterium]|nr:isochorismatase family cysteine hydrolase [Phycisphaerae bacterium]
MKKRGKSGGTALLIVDVINDLEFPGGEKVLPWAERMAGRLEPVMRRARAAGVPVVYVNDNFGLWRSNFKEVVKHCTRAGARGRGVVRRLLPKKDDYFILKPKHSAFFATSLAPLLEYLKVRRLVMAGIATNLCVLFSAHDAHMHEYGITVLSDCCCAESDADHNWALDQLQRFVGARVCLGDEWAV